MSEEPQYTQIKRPVSRIAEKVLGWLNWIGLLLLTVITMFIALVSFSNNTSIQNLEQSINNNDLAQQVLTNNSLNTTQFVIWLQNGIWAVIVYLIVCLLISFLALISMNIRVLSGILFLIASIITLPLVLLLATIVIPVLFFIVAIMMFVRKDNIETVPYYGGGYVPYEDNYDNYDRYDREPVRRPYDYSEDEKTPHYEEDSHEQHEVYDEEDDDVKPYVPKKDRVQASHQTEDTEKALQSEEPITKHEDESEPEFLSRQAKYKQKSEEEVKEQQEQEAYEREQERMQEPSEEPEAVKYRDPEPRKGETAEEKAARKREKKERKRRAKEARKNRPSAVNQRRMNFEERRSFNQGKTPTTQEIKEDDTKSTKETQTDDSDEKS